MKAIKVKISIYTIVEAKRAGAFCLNFSFSPKNLDIGCIISAIAKATIKGKVYKLVR
jgi:hypothetical protein